MRTKHAKILAKLSPTEMRKLWSIQLFRTIITALIVVFITRTIDLGTSEVWLVGAIVLGSASSLRFLFRNRTCIRTLYGHGIALSLIWFIFYIGQLATTGNISQHPSGDFALYRYYEHFVLLAIFYGISFIATWLFWTKPQTATIESCLLSIGFVWLLSGHRNYNLDTPKKINELAWAYGIETQHFLLGLAVTFTLFLGLYLVLSHTRPLFGRALPIRSQGRFSKIAMFTAPTIVALLLIAFATYINGTYAQELSRASNGVGTKNNSEGKSPLGFHSAVGKTKQPAALVRLESDFDSNPWAPMLYLREGALSHYNGREFVVASSIYDSDVPRVKPGQPFVALGNTTTAHRKEIIQSIFFLSQHSNPFAIDFPQSIRLLKNPDDTRFKLAYSATSLAPVIKLDSLIGEQVGSSAWDKTTWEHYLRAPGSLSDSHLDDEIVNSEDPVVDTQGEDLRYKAMTNKLTATLDAPVMKAVEIAKFLSDNSIYTRKPGHSITRKGDPVAPYLFGEKKRGYCVHFSHAAVYMMRLAGIPARIGTGYLTDLNYAKDGHILLHLGDRHAWPEVYIENRGWAVVDIVPANAENEQPIIPNEKLLEELMSKIDPLGPIPAQASGEDSKGNTGDELISSTFVRRTLWLALILTLTSFLTLKLWLRHGWRLATNRNKAHLAYISFASLLTDLGVSRDIGETRREFASRVHTLKGLNSNEVTSIKERSAYDRNYHTTNNQDIVKALAHFGEHFNNRKKKFVRCLAFLSPLSLTRWGKW